MSNAPRSGASRSGAPRTARERGRQQLTREIKSLALAQLADSGAGELSLRAIARELGMVSSALYRYFRNRDELLTALIVDAYGDLADALGTADGALPSDRFRERWVTACTTLRAWALAEPHRFALIYGTPVPGYRAPADTVAPAERVMTALTGIVAEAAGAGVYDAVDLPEVGDSELAGQLDRVRAVLGEQIPPGVMARLVAAFGQVVGLVNLELAGHFVGGFEPAAALFRHAADELADALGLPEGE